MNSIPCRPLRIIFTVRLGLKFNKPLPSREYFQRDWREYVNASEAGTMLCKRTKDRCNVIDKDRNCETAFCVIRVSKASEEFVHSPSGNVREVVAGDGKYSLAVECGNDWSSGCEKSNHINNQSRHPWVPPLCRYPMTPFPLISHGLHKIGRFYSLCPATAYYHWAPVNGASR